MTALMIENEKKKLTVPYCSVLNVLPRISPTAPDLRTENVQYLDGSLRNRDEGRPLPLLRTSNIVPCKVQLHAVHPLHANA